MKRITLILTVILVGTLSYAQDYRTLIAEGTHTVEYISEVAERHFDTVGRERGTGFKPFKRWQYFAERAMDETGKLKSPEFYYNELEAYNARMVEEGIADRTVVGTWEEMGPTYWNATSGYNPGVGRITSIAVEDGDINHIIVGGETGGVWRTIDGGTNWTVLTDNLANIDVYALAIDPLDNSTYYWGSKSGSIFKSVDSGATWTLQGSLPGGNVNRILIHPTDNSKIYASAEGAGLYKSTNNGVTWSIITNGATNGYDFEFKPGDPNTIYASGNNFYISTDGGTTFTAPDGLSAWTQEFENANSGWTTASSNQNNTVSPNTGTGMALFYVGNFNQHRTKLVTPSMDLGGAASPEVKFSFTNVNWAGDVDELRVFYKTSSAGSWVQLAEYTTESNIWNDVTLALPNPTADYYLAFEGTSKWGRGLTLDDVSIETPNNGVIFSDGFESSPNEFSSGAKMIGVSEDDPNVVYVVEAAGGAFGAFHKSTNQGQNFSKLNHANKNYFGYSSDPEDSNDAGRGQAPRDMDVAVNPDNANDVHIAGINTWRSTDGGTSFNITSQWTPNSANGQNIGYCHADIDLLMFVKDGNNPKLFVGSDGGIYKAENPTVINSNYYTDLTPGLGIRQFYKIGISQTNPVIVTGGSQDNGSTVLGADGVWRDWWGADGMEGFVDKNDSNLIYGTSQFGSFIKSFNGGNSVFGMGQPDGKGGQNNWNWIVPFEQDPTVQNTLYCAFDLVYKSTNGGNSWTTISPDFNASIDHLKIAPSNNQYMYLAINGAFWYTISGGSVWRQSGLDLNGGRINQIAVHPTDPGKVAIATTNSDKVYVSTNNGATWTSMRFDLPNFSAQALAWQDNGEDGLYVGMNYGIYYTDNSLGNTWAPFSNGLPNVRINELEINTADDKIYAATYGRGLWRSDIYNPALSVNDFNIQDLSMYPNPGNDEINLKWNQSEDVSVKIYNTLGKLMFYTKKVNLQNGLKINTSAYGSGMYFVKLNTTKGEVTKKLILN
ncbi:VPS10 domain-containing protein [Winogradskyella ursingii]|uniref:VPS10 domain-containing protein n=1 Tax=Winogradskyella ursingii TaxID=2686079 RepID=UPI0015C7F951|nr:T9SS type A sorting domain-containing protein [Winogradskyella ursingii]